MNLIERLFRFTRAPAARQIAAQQQQPPEDHALSRTLDLDGHATMHSELVRMLARDTLRYCGIPEGWVECRVLIVASANGQTSLHARLVVKHWDQHLANYAVAFQARLMAEIERFEPRAADWLHSVSWQYLPDCGCPFTEMPGVDTWAAFAGAEAAAPSDKPIPASALWQTPEPPRAQFKPTEPMDDVQEDLAKLFAVRDAEIAEVHSGRAPKGTMDFQATQPFDPGR